MTVVGERVLVTGAAGFVGGAVVTRLAAEGALPRAVVRASRRGALPATDDVVTTPGLESDVRLSALVDGCSAVVHAAAHVHKPRGRTANAWKECRRVNVDATLRLAAAAADSGVERFVFVSSIKVNGERTIDRPFTAADPARPEDAYAWSKAEAERGLRDLAMTSPMEVVIIRPALVYGPGVRGNFLSLLRLIASGMPLPLGAVRNRRSMIGVQNLVDLVVAALTHPAAANETFLASDDADLSTTDLVERIAFALDTRVRLVAVPPWALRTATALVWRRDVAARLLDSLQVDVEKTRRLLGWSPPLSVDAELRDVAQWFRASRASTA